MVIVLTLIHVIVCFFLIIVVLLQSGKAADLAGAFGGMGSQTAFGPRGSASLLSRATTVAAALFMLTSMTLAILATRASGGTGSSVLGRQSQGQRSTQSTPAPKSTPAPGQPAGPITVTPESGKPAQIPVPQQTQPAKPATPPQK